MLIKGSLIDSKTGLYGVFYLSINLTTKIIEQCEAVVSSNPKFLEHTNPKHSFHAFARSITSSKLHTSFLQISSLDLQKTILKISKNDTMLQELCEKLQENSVDGIKKIFLSSIREDFRVEEFTIKIFLEKDEDNKRQEVPNSFETSNKSSIVKPTSIFVDFKLLIDPINGHELKKIEKGDYLKVQLILNTTTSHSVANNYSLIDENNNVKASIVKVITTKYQHNIMEIFVELVNGVCGYIKEESNILVKVPSQLEVKKHLEEFREKYLLQEENFNDNLTEQEENFNDNLTEQEENFASKDRQYIPKTFVFLAIFIILLIIILWFLIVLLLGV